MAQGQSKGYRSAAAKIDRQRKYSLAEAVGLARGTARAKFDETVELAMRIGVDPRKADQNVRGTVVLPHGTGKAVRVAVFAKVGEPRRCGVVPIGERFRRLLLKGGELAVAENEGVYLGKRRL